MAYQVYRYNGTFFVEVKDQSVDSSSSDIKFIGKNYAGYGTIENENFLHLLENFRGTTQPRRPVIGQLWYDESTNKIKFYDSSAAWRTMPISNSSTTAPLGLTTVDKGALWFDETNKQMNVWDGANYVLIGPDQAPGFGETRLRSDVIRDNGNTAHPVIKIISDSSVIGIMSNDTFDIGNITIIPGFSRINQGITIKDTPISGVTTSNFRFWGTSSDAIKLAGHPITDFVLRTGSGSTFDDAGFTVGNDTDLKIFIENTNVPVLQNTLGNNIKVRITVGTDNNDVVVFSAAGLTPGRNNAYDIGTSSFKYRNLFAANIYGDVTGNITGNVYASDATLMIDNVLKQFTGTSVGTHKGDVRAADNTLIFDATTNTLSSLNANITNINANTLTLIDKLVGDLKGDLYANDDSMAFNNGTKQFYGSLVGNADTASRLINGKYINGVLFDGTANIDIIDPYALPKSGGVMTGAITLPGAPTNTLHAATKGYVDAQVSQIPLFFSLDTGGLDITGVAAGSVVAVLNELCPPTSFPSYKVAHIASTIQNVSSTVATSTSRWISINYVSSVTVTTTVQNPTRNNLLIYRINSTQTSWEYVSG